jgi:NAD(P)-dependent dehydrogenase (short-subunit alcohol dehydrogenase family)
LPGTIFATADAIVAAGGQALAARCDISRDEDIDGVVTLATETFGRLDILVNNAMSPSRGAFADTPIGLWDESIATNIRSLLVFCRRVLPEMSKGSGGSIINISSGAAEHGSNAHLPTGFGVYAMAKAAMERFSTAVAPELATHGVAINALRPGAVKTELALRELGEDFDWSNWTAPEAVVPAVVFLAGQRGDEFTGRIVDSPQFGTRWP